MKASTSSTKASAKATNNAAKGNARHPRATSKKDKAIRIYNNLVAKGKARKDIVSKFVKDLDMGASGASTYYQNCRTAWAE